jgi:hypothetical protein
VLSPACSLHEEGGITCILMPEVSLLTAAGVETMTVLLCPSGQGGYVSRLMLERQVKSTSSLNWQQIVLLGRAWTTWSWNNIPAGLPWITIFAEHARCLR